MGDAPSTVPVEQISAKTPDPAGLNAEMKLGEE
jgi:hypothetical protein